MKKTLALLAAYCLLLPGLFNTATSQAPPGWNSADMYLALRKLNVLGSVLYVAAHPDDENTRLITYFSKDKTYRTGYLSLTRGDGGQNLIGDEQGIELGLIRTQELLAARRIDGGEQFFSRAYDFGYSKTPEETFTKWDKEKILADVVWVIRLFQPDVIITRFPTTGEGGHGHHTASAILANEAFTIAADATKFPGQLKYVQPWQAKRILWNGFNFGGSPAAGNDMFRLDVGGYNPLLGKSYGEIAAESRSQHKSQGFGVPASRGESIESFKTTGGPAPVDDLMDGVELTWKRVPGGESIAQMIEQLAASFDLLHPEKSVEGLVKLYKALNGMPDSYWKRQKLSEVQELIGQCSGLFIDATSPEQFAVQTDSIRVNFSFNNRLGVDAVLQKVQLDKFDSSFSQSLGKNKNWNFSKVFYVPADKNITQPYWLANEMEEGYFNVKDQTLIGVPDVQPSYNAVVQVKIAGEVFNFQRPVKYKFTDPVRGEIYWPLVVIPAFSLRVSPQVGIDNNLMEKYQKTFTSYKNNNLITAYKAYANDSVTLKDGQRRIARGIISDSFLLQKNQVREVEVATEAERQPIYSIDNPTKIDRRWQLENYFKNKSGDMLHDLVTVKHDHIPAIVYFKPAKNIVRMIEMDIVGKKIGYIVGAGDKVPEALGQMGYEVTLLTEKELSRNNLSQFDAIITGVRAYNTNEWMNKYYDKLMKYVNEGGNLIVQYNTSSQIGPVRAKMGPYNFNISRTRVTDENAEVTFLKPKHPVLNFPNKITPEDFKGWIQERSIYHAAAWDTTKFQTIFAMKDKDDKDADEGSLIIAKYGKGYFTYTGLVFFRELPAGVPGAYRLIANIIALNRKKAF